MLRFGFQHQFVGYDQYEQHVHFTLNVPKPINCTGSPSFRLAVIASKVASNAALACFCLTLQRLQLHQLNLFCS